ncbi:MAG TPA: hypothetical protein VMM60_17455 [Ilumatobacter sp.]|nr:hypothetical protein [Ilumatobacter sp.]
MDVVVRPFERSDRDQLTALVNAHVATVLPGVALSVNTVLSQLEREPREVIVDPWVAQRQCVVAVHRERIVAAALLHRFRNDADVSDSYRGVGDIRWLLCARDYTEAGRQLLTHCIDTFAHWDVRRRYADGALPAMGCYGIPDSWPHIRGLLVEAGFDGPARVEDVFAARCEDLLGHALDGAVVRRSVGSIGVRIELRNRGTEMGYIEIDQTPLDTSRNAPATSWAAIGNLHIADKTNHAETMPALLALAAEWLLLGGVNRLIAYYADDVDPPEYLTTLHVVGFTRLARTERGWELPEPVKH